MKKDETISPEATKIDFLGAARKNAKTDFTTNIESETFCLWLKRRFCDRSHKSSHSRHFTFYRFLENKTRSIYVCVFFIVISFRRVFHVCGNKQENAEHLCKCGKSVFGLKTYHFLSYVVIM